MSEAEAGLDAAEKLTEKLNGYLVIRADDKIVIRVPVEHFREALAQATQLGDELRLPFPWLEELGLTHLLKL